MFLNQFSVDEHTIDMRWKSRKKQWPLLFDHDGVQLRDSNVEFVAVELEGLKWVESLRALRPAMRCPSTSTSSVPKRNFGDNQWYGIFPAQLG